MQHATPKTPILAKVPIHGWCCQWRSKSKWDQRFFEWWISTWKINAEYAAPFICRALCATKVTVARVKLLLGFAEAKEYCNHNAFLGGGF